MSHNINESKSTDFNINAIEGADLILVSHTHHDHIDDVKFLMDHFDSKVDKSKIIVFVTSHFGTL